MTQEDAQIYIDDAKEHMIKAVSHLETELSHIRAGKASPAMFDSVKFPYYGADTPISQAANISVQDAKTLTIQPWDKAALSDIERAILAANLGVTPQNDGIMIRIVIPPLTEERRKELVKKCNAEGEQARIAIRNIRRDANESVKKLQKDGLSEDIVKSCETTVQDMTNKYIAIVEKHCAEKEGELLKV